MDLVVDANIIFSALIKDSHTRHFLLFGYNSLHVPDFVIEEIEEHMEEIRDKTGLSKKQLIQILDELMRESKIRKVDYSEIREFIPQAEKVSPDPDDVQYFALAMRLGCPIWSNDKKLKQQNVVQVLNSSEVIGKNLS